MASIPGVSAAGFSSATIHAWAEYGLLAGYALDLRDIGFVSEPLRVVVLSAGDRDS